APSELFTLSLHDALPILGRRLQQDHNAVVFAIEIKLPVGRDDGTPAQAAAFGPQRLAGLELQAVPAFRFPLIRVTVDDSVQQDRSEEHTSELQSRFDLVC